MVSIAKRSIGRHFPQATCNRQFYSRLSLAPTARTMCSLKAKLIIELDGGQHLEQEDYDEERTKYLEAQGYKVLRFWNNDVVNNIEGVILAIIYAMEDEASKD